MCCTEWKKRKKLKMRVWRLPGIVQNTGKKVRQHLTVSANSIHRCIKKRRHSEGNQF